MIVSGSSRLLRTAVPPSCAGCVPSSRRSAHKLVAVQLLSDALPSLGARNQVVALSPGLARNRLVPAGLAIYVGRDGVGVSVRRDMERRGAAMREVERRRREGAVGRRASGVLETLEQGNAPPADPLAPARAAERALALSLAALAPPSHPLVFTRLTTSPTSSDLFGSVSVPDVLAALRERGVEGLSSASSGAVGAEGGAQGAFREREGVANGRVKQVGEFVFAVELRATGESVPVRVEVRREDK